MVKTLAHEDNSVNYLLFLQSKLAEDINVPHAAKITYAFMSNFFRAEGFAFCSNEWLAQKVHATERSIQRYLNLLEKYGYIYRQVIKQGMKTIRRIWIPAEYAKYLMENNKTDDHFRKILEDAKIKPSPHSKSCKQCQNSKNVITATADAPRPRQPLRQNKTRQHNRKSVVLNTAYVRVDCGNVDKSENSPEAEKKLDYPVVKKETESGVIECSKDDALFLVCKEEPNLNHPAEIITAAFEKAWQSFVTSIVKPKYWEKYFLGIFRNVLKELAC